MSSSPDRAPNPDQAARAPAPGVERSEYERLANRAKLLSWLSLVWMAVEGGVAGVSDLRLLASWSGLPAA